MLISVATANLYYRPFGEVLEIITEAGFQNIELDMFWANKKWTMAQHLKEISVKEAVKLVKQSGLRIASIHDGGGTLENSQSITGYINPTLDQYLDEMGYAPEYLVFHTPHIEGDPGEGWWRRTSGEIARALEKYREACSFITVENMPSLEGYYVPLLTPEELNSFVCKYDLWINLDTTHYAQMGINIASAARKISKKVKTIHLSDFRAGQTHVFIGEGELNFAGFFEVFDKKNISAVTLECSLLPIGIPDQEINQKELISRMREAHTRLHSLI